MATIKITPIDIKIPAQKMKEIGLKEKQLIKEDALNGISQDAEGSPLGNYKSEQYKRYKSNYMKRFTNRTGNKGTKLKQYQGQSIASNETSKVNMTLTGKLFDGLHVKEAKENEVTISYLPKDAGKIIGNRALGREVVGLNNKNIDAIVNEAMKELDKKIDAWAKEDIKIDITF